MRTRPFAVVALLAGAVHLAGPAQAHVVITRAQVAPSTTVELEYRAPVERPGTTNRKLFALVPAPFTVASCRVPSSIWTCTLDTTTRAPDTYVTWETPVGGSPQDLRFFATVRTPSAKDAREYRLPVVQTYSDGHVARWIDEGEPFPAPRLVVAAGAASASPRTQTPPSHGNGGSPAAPATSNPTAPAATASGGPTGTAVPTALPTPAGSDQAAPEPTSTAVVSVALDPEAGGGSGPLLAGILGTLGLAGAGTAALVVRRRRSRA